jgi:hypothetical protein
MNNLTLREAFDKIAMLEFELQARPSKLAKAEAARILARGGVPILQRRNRRQHAVPATLGRLQTCLNTAYQPMPVYCPLGSQQYAAERYQGLLEATEQGRAWLLREEQA